MKWQHIVFILIALWFLIIKPVIRWYNEPTKVEIERDRQHRRSIGQP